MNERSDFDRVLLMWFDDGPSTMPDRVVGSVAARIARQRQRRLLGFQGRFPMPARQLAAVAAAITIGAVALTAFALLPLIGGSPPTEAPRDPSPTPAQVRQLGDGELSAGTYETHPFGGPNAPITATLRVPSRWSGFGGWALLGPKGTHAPDGIGIAMLAPSGLFSDPCHWDRAGDGKWPQPGDSEPMGLPADYTRALMYSFEGHRTPASETVLSGIPGRRMDLELPAADALADCDRVAGQGGGAYFVFGSSDPLGIGLYAQGPSQIWHVWLLDVQGTTIAIVIDEYEGTPPADKAAALGIVETMTISR